MSRTPVEDTPLIDSWDFFAGGIRVTSPHLVIRVLRAMIRDGRSSVPARQLHGDQNKIGEEIPPKNKKWMLLGHVRPLSCLVCTIAYDAASRCSLRI